MENEEIKRLIEATLAGSQAFISGDGRHFEAVVVSEQFEGKTLLQEQKMVYAAVGDLLRSGRLHALSIKAYTPAEWAQVQRG